MLRISSHQAKEHHHNVMMGVAWFIGQIHTHTGHSLTWDQCDLALTFAFKPKCTHYDVTNVHV